MIVIVKHIDIEGPGTLGDFLKAQKRPFKIIELGAGEFLPSTLVGVDAVVVLGGPMNVYEEDKYPFLKAENQFIQNVLMQGLPYLGICLGAQLLAKAAGARVVTFPVKEIGWYHVQLTAEGKTDPFLEGFRDDEHIYHWHGDMFHIPPNGQLLATAQGCPHQALRVGSNAYGVQFHVEVTDRSIKEWCEEYIENDALLDEEALLNRRVHAKAMLKDYYQYVTQFHAQANRIYHNFMKIIDHAKISSRTN